MRNIQESLSESLEDYMEAIFHIEQQKRAARAKDIADRLHVSNSSVTGALRLLGDKELVNYSPYDIITLTDKGKALAEDIVHRHETLREFFVEILAVDETEAETAACKMEHGLSRGILHKLIQCVQFLKTCPNVSHGWLKWAEMPCEHGGNPVKCETCLQQALAELHAQNRE